MTTPLHPTLTIAVVPEGPIASDGRRYYYSRGERLYLDTLAAHFKKIILITYVFRPDDSHYGITSQAAFEAPNIEVVEMPLLGSSPGFIAKIAQMARIFLIMLRTLRRADVLYLFLPGYPSAMAWAAGRLWRVPYFVYGADDWDTASGEMFKWERWRSSWLFRLFAFVNHRMEKIILRGAIFSVAAGGALVRKYSFLCPNSFPTRPRMTLAPRHRFHRQDSCAGPVVTILSVGGLHPGKAQDILIRAFASLFGRRGNLRLVIVGEGPLREELTRLSERLGVSQSVVFAGTIADESALYALYRDADVFALTSVSEGFPRVLYEAMAHSLPIVTTAVGGVPDLLRDQESALIVPLGSVTAVEAALARLLDDPATRRRLIMGGQAVMSEVFAGMDDAQVPRLLDQFMIRPKSGVSA